MRTGSPSSIFDSSLVPPAVFGTFAFGGAIFIAVSKTYGTDPLELIGIPILLMFVYLGLSLGLGRLRLHSEQTGDNLYYMGFLFTLTSLGVSLYQFGTGSSTDEVVRNFGIAISSTITGIGLRILYNQTRRDPADIERATRHELADMTRRVRAEMENVAREFADFRRTSNMMLQEGFEEIAEQAEKNGEKVRETMDHLATSAIKPVEDASARLLEAIDASSKRISEKAGNLSERTERLSSAVKDTANSVSSSGKGVTASLGSLARKLDTLAGKVDSASLPEQVMKEALPPLVGQLSAALSSHLKAAEAVTDRQSANVAQVGEALKSAAASVERSAAAAERFDARAAELFRAVKEQNDRIERFFGALQKQQAAAQAAERAEAVPDLVGDKLRLRDEDLRIDREETRPSPAPPRPDPQPPQAPAGPSKPLVEPPEPRFPARPSRSFPRFPGA